MDSLQRRIARDNPQARQAYLETTLNAHFGTTEDHVRTLFFRLPVYVEEKRLEDSPPNHSTWLSSVRGQSPMLWFPTMASTKVGNERHPASSDTRSLRRSSRQGGRLIKGRVVVTQWWILLSANLDQIKAETMSGHHLYEVKGETAVLALNLLLQHRANCLDCPMEPEPPSWLESSRHGHSSCNTLLL
jgi:hypothetical protein